TAGAVLGCDSSRNNPGVGIAVGNGSTVDNCTAYFNHSAGIATDSNTSIRNCTADFGDADGILATNSCLITGNNVTRNGTGGANGGIHVFGLGNRIDQNNAVGNFNTGISMIGGGSLMIRNSATGNLTNYYAIGPSMFGLIDANTGGITNINPWI